MSADVTPLFIVRQLLARDVYYFTPRLVADLFDLDLARVYRLVARLKEQALVAEVEKGKYLVLGLEPERVLANPLFFGSQLVDPGYVSYWSALHFYGFTEQAPREVFVATTRKKRPVRFHGQAVRFVTLQRRKFFGYQRVTVGGLPVLIADEAKAIIDGLDQPRYAGGIAEVASALAAAVDDANVATLVEYANRIGDRSLGSRLGYLLTLLGIEVEPQGATTGAGLIRSVSPIKLDAGGAEGGLLDRQWRVVVNVPSHALFPVGVA